MSEPIHEPHGGFSYPGKPLGGAGASLRTLTMLGLPVPPGFLIGHPATDDAPAEFAEQVSGELRGLEQSTGRRFGTSGSPLLLAVRPDVEFPLPGMMSAVTHIGLNDESVDDFAAWAGNASLAWTSYCTLVATFGVGVLGIDSVRFDRALRVVRPSGVLEDLTVEECRRLLRAFQHIVADVSGRPFPQDPHEQLGQAIHSAFGTPGGPLARAYLESRNMPPSATAAASVRMMVFPGAGTDSGTGVASTRDPVTGAPGLSGLYLPNVLSWAAAHGSREALPMHELARRHPVPHRELVSGMRTLEEHVLDLCDAEFVIEKGRLWFVAARVGRRTAASAFQVAAALHGEGLIDADETLRRVTGDQLGQLMFTRFAENDTGRLIATAVAASPGAAVGHVVFDSATAVSWARSGRPVILVRPETGPADLDGIVHASGILTSRGGQTSHAAVVARGMGRTCVCGAVRLFVDVAARRFTTRDGVSVGEGELVSIDGTSGQVYLGAVDVVPSPVIEYFEGRLDPAGHDTDGLVRAVHQVMVHADTRRRLRVLANADTPEDAARARRFGAEGIGLCRTEHMLLGSHRRLVEQLITLDGDEDDRLDILRTLLSLQQHDLTEILTEMDGHPVAVRLLDAPLHEFLPDITELAVRVAVADATGEASEEDHRLLRAARRTHEANPMLGMRGVRLGLVIPGLYETQVRAIGEAVARCLVRGGRPDVRIILPMIGDGEEFAVARRSAEAVLTEIAARTGSPMPAGFGAMIELPRAALTAGDLARHAELFSFGTNDLTQTTWGMSRDDAETSFVSVYLDRGILARSPFETCDQAGVGRLIEIAARDGRRVNPDLELGVCGEHSGDPRSIRLFHRLGMDYVSCAPFQVPIARLEAGRAAVGVTGAA